MSDFMKDIINQSTLDECNDILSHAESIVGTNIINNVNELTKELDCLIDQMHKKVLREEYQISDFVVGASILIRSGAIQ